MLVDRIQLRLQQFVADAGYEKVFSEFDSILRNDPNNALRKDAVLIEGTYKDIVRDFAISILTLEERDQRLAKVRSALLELINRITFEDLNDTYRTEAENHRNIPWFHALTCNRAKQKTAFDEHYFVEPGPQLKFRFFYLYGDTQQELESLFTRFAYDRNGLINNRWRQGLESTTHEPLFRLCKPEFSESPRLFEMYILRDLFASFFDPVNEQNINPESRLTSLLESPEIKKLGPDGQVFVLFTMDDYNWHETITPIVIKRLFEGFYNCPLPPESPKFFFFFGLEYTKTNQDVKAQVADAIQRAEYGVALHELEPVDQKSLADWFNRYKEVIAPGADPAQIAAQFFPTSQPIDMADVEPKLKQLIEKHNKLYIK